MSLQNIPCVKVSHLRKIFHPLRPKACARALRCVRCTDCLTASGVCCGVHLPAGGRISLICSIEGEGWEMILLQCFDLFLLMSWFTPRLLNSWRGFFLFFFFSVKPKFGIIQAKLSNIFPPSSNRFYCPVNSMIPVAHFFLFVSSCHSLFLLLLISLEYGKHLDLVEWLLFTVLKHSFSLPPMC